MTTEEKLQLKSKKVKSGCLLWTGGTFNGRYGRIAIDGTGGKEMLAHRASYQTFVGPIPEGMFVCHKCDNPICINPRHLFLGTAADNNADMVAKGRSARGEKHGRAKLTSIDVVKIRNIHQLSKFSYKRIASMYSVTPMVIFNIIKGRNWTHI